jgi:uncharacterized iron-regulated membrane protein
MSIAERWLRRPQTTWLYKAIFQVHLWTGIALGVYVAVVCARGSAIVCCNDFYDLFEAWTKAGPNSAQRHLITAGYTATKWLGDLHGSLKLGPRGLILNGAGGFLTGALCLSGLTVW